MENVYKTTTLPSGAIIKETNNPIVETPIIPVVVQPTNEEINSKLIEVNNNIMTVMSGIFDLYMK